MPDDLLCIHRCDRADCVNPDHLVLGTKRDAASLTTAKGRPAGARGRVRYATLEEALMSKVERRSPDECWPWTGALAGPGYSEGKGYGVFSHRGRRYRAHCGAYECFIGPIPKGLFVCHRCDNPVCCNPGHLFAGTHEQNVADAVAKRRHTHRETHPMRKITAEDAAAIRADPRRAEEIAAEYGLSRAQVYNIKSGKNWGPE